MMRLNPIADWPRAEREQIAGVFTDIDDTLTTNGRVPSGAFQAMECLRAAGLLVVPVTGRPAGWCDMIARTWPVDAVVGENGAFAFRYEAERKRMRRFYTDPAEQRMDKLNRLAAIRDEVLDRVAGAGISADQAYRETDLAIDFAEDVDALNDDAIGQIVEIFERHGATARVSSIHVNGWFGDHSKLSMTRQMMLEFFGVDLEATKDRYVFIGDSPNDAPMFGYFPSAVGVANIGELAHRCEALPTWITQGHGTSGFIEMTEALLN